MRRAKPGLLAALLALCLALCAGCARQVTVSPAAAERTSGVGYYFDTVVTFTLYGAEEGLLEELLAACGRYEQLLSKTVTGSDVDRVNHAQGQPVRVDHETWLILQEARAVSLDTGGAFSVTIAPVSALWDFTGGTGRMPTAAELEAALPLVDDSRLELLAEDQVRLPAGMEIDLGGIAKGYIADQCAALTLGRAAGAVLNFGGNVYVVGQKPDATPFRVGIRDPDSEAGEACCIVSLREGTVVTSGIYERWFERDGVRYHHILDPKTGSSAQSDLASATVICHSSMEADAVATACVVLGSDQALSLLDRLSLDGLLITREGRYLTTAGFADRYSLTYTGQSR